MNKTDTILWLMRAHEAIRKLPEGTEINSVEVCLYGEGNRITVFLNDKAKIKNIVQKTVIRYKDSDRGRVECLDSSGTTFWWGCDFDDDTDP